MIQFESTRRECQVLEEMGRSFGAPIMESELADARTDDALIAAGDLALKAFLACRAASNSLYSERHKVVGAAQEKVVSTEEALKAEKEKNAAMALELADLKEKLKTSELENEVRATESREAK